MPVCCGESVSTAIKYSCIRHLNAMGDLLYHLLLNLYLFIHLFIFTDAIFTSAGGQHSRSTSLPTVDYFCQHQSLCIVPHVFSGLAEENKSNHESASLPFPPVLCLSAGCW